MTMLMGDPAMAAIMRGLCDIADRARDEVRFHHRDWWLLRRRVLDQDAQAEHAVYLFTSVVREHKRLLYSLLRSR